MKIYDIAVVGAGPAGCMAAISGAQQGKNVILLEKNKEVGRKLLLTGNGRCNITNSAPFEIFLEKFGSNGSFYRDVFTKFTNHDLMDFFRGYGLDFIEEGDGRIFPATEKAKSVRNVLYRSLEDHGVEIIYSCHLKHLQKHSNVFKLICDDQPHRAYNVILATGGASFRETGSSGDGFKIAKELGHQLTELKPGNVPLTTKEDWIPGLTGITLKDVGLSFQNGGKITILPRGNLLFTHFGISGPVILDMSSMIMEILDKTGDLKLYIDFRPELKEGDLKAVLIADFQRYSKKILKNYLKTYMPQSMVEPVLKTVQLHPTTKLNQITKGDRIKLLRLIKSLPLTINGYLPLNNAMVTCGGVLKREIKPRTMESNLVPGLYFAGEVIDGCGRRGGFNLQQAFSTGYVAGYSAAQSND